MDNSDGTFESANRVYEKKMVCPTINTCGGVACKQRLSEDGERGNKPI